MQTLFEAIQESCSSATWSRGVELVRADAVSGERQAKGEVVLRVATRGGMITPMVTLYLEDEDWECSCNGHEDPCEHIAAAAIALRKARKEGKDLPVSTEHAGRLRYRFYDEKGGELGFKREIVTGDAVHTLSSTLDALASGRVDGPRFSATQQDLNVERALGSKRRGALARDHLTRVLGALAGSEAVMMGERPIQIATEPVLPHGCVVDAPGGVRLYVEQDPSITRVYSNGVVLCGDLLRPIGTPRLTGRELDELPRGRFFPNDQLAELVTNVLPSLEERIPVEVRTERLPATSRVETPRILLEVSREKDALSVLPKLVYGEPPCARIDAGRLVHIRGPIPIRDEAAERGRVVHLQSELGLVPGRRVTLTGADAIKMADRLAGWRGEISGQAHRDFHTVSALEPRLRIEGERIDLSFSVPQEPGAKTGSGPGGASPEAVLAAWSDGASLVPLSGGGFAPLPADWLGRFGDRVADLLAARSADGTLPTCVLPDLGRLCDELDEPPPPRLERLRPVLESFEGIVPAPLPDDLTAELRVYQQQGIDWLCFLREAGLGGLLADDMGLGKTIQALCALPARSLVVAPTSLLHNWIDEMERFRPGLRWNLYHGPKRLLDEDADVVLTSYAILRLDADLLGDIRWDAVVLDEAQTIKNPNSQVAQAAFGLNADFRMALTGTPVENRLEELWSQLHFLNRGLLGGLRDFQERYARPIADGDTDAADRLRERIHPFVLRRLKRDVAPELPPRTEVVVHCELSEEERAVYDAVRAATVAQVVEQLRSGQSGGVMAALEALLRLRQAACHSALVPGQTATGSTKIDVLVQRLEQAVEDGHRALVFSQWTGLLDLIEPHLGGSAIDFERLDGSTRDRAGVVRRFQHDEGPPVMLVSLKAGGTGLNLTAADHVFLMDPWWNPAVEDQAADRVHRIGQTRPVVVHRIVSLDTVEEGILALHTRKRALSEVVMGGVGASEGLSRDDLLALLDE
jgi:superfamily II DNA or RNA helicase